MSLSFSPSKRGSRVPALLFLVLLLLIPQMLTAKSVTLQRGGVVMREGPGNFFAIVGILEKGMSVALLEEKTPGWARVKSDDLGAGWISENVLAVAESGGMTDIDLLASAEGLTANVSKTAISAMIKGLSVSLDVETGSIPVIEPLPGVAADSVSSFRGGFAVVDDVRPLPATQLGLQMMPSFLAAGPALAAHQLKGWGGRQRRFEGYCNMVLLWLAERAGAQTLAPRVLIARQGFNAQAYPGGWIVVGGELFALVRDEAELAGLLAHELAHGILQHGERALADQSWRVGVEDAFAELEAETAGKSDVEKDLESFASEVLKQAQRRYTLNDELQADSAATVWLLRAGYDPDGLLRLMKRMRETTGTRLVGHGSVNLAWVYSRDEIETRIAAVEKVLKRYKRYRGRGARFEQRFMENTR